MIEDSILKKESMATILFGVSNCGGGIVIVNGKAHKIPPRGPVFEKISDALKTVLREMNIKE